MIYRLSIQKHCSAKNSKKTRKVLTLMFTFTCWFLRIAFDWIFFAMKKKKKVRKNAMLQMYKKKSHGRRLLRLGHSVKAAEWRIVCKNQKCGKFCFPSSITFLVKREFRLFKWRTTTTYRAGNIWKLYRNYLLTSRSIFKPKTDIQLKVACWGKQSACSGLEVWYKIHPYLFISNI